MLSQLSGQSNSPEEQSQQAEDEARLQLQSDKLTTKKAINAAKVELASVNSQIPYDPSAIIASKQKVAELEAGYKALEELETEDFGS